MIDRQRLEFAAEGFLSTMRRIYADRGGSPDLAIRTLKEYHPSDQRALLKALENAINMASPEFDAAFRTWLFDRNLQNPV